MCTHEVKRQIMWGDLDALGIVFYPRYYEWIDGAGHLFFKEIGLDMQFLWNSRNILFGLVETSCRYFAPGRYHEEISILTSLTELNKKTITLTHSIRLAHGEKKLAKGIEKRICLDVDNQNTFRAIDIPKDIYGIFEKILSHDHVSVLTE